MATLDGNQYESEIQNEDEKENRCGVASGSFWSFLHEQRDTSDGPRPRAHVARPHHYTGNGSTCSCRHRVIVVVVGGGGGRRIGGSTAPQHPIRRSFECPLNGMSYFIIPWEEARHPTRALGPAYLHQWERFKL